MSRPGRSPARIARATRAAWAAAVALSAAAADARVIEFPIQVDHGFARERLVEQVFTGPEESTQVLRDGAGCNEIVLSHPVLSGRDGLLHVVANFDAKLGAGVGGWCLNAVRHTGILDAALEARVQPRLPIVEFRVVQSEILDPDGQKRLVGTLWDWVRSQVHPQLETFRLDLYKPIAELRTFVPVLFPNSDFERVKYLIESIALTEASVGTDAIAVRVKLDVPEPARRGEPAPVEDGAAAPPPEAPLTEQEIAHWDTAWQSWDAFLTFVIKHSSRESSGDLRAELRDIFFDARYDIVQILESSEARESDPVPPLFLKTWERLAPVLRKLTTQLPGEDALHYLSLITAADAFRTLEELGPDYGVELSTDGLRRMARMIEPVPFTDPTAYSEVVDVELRDLFGFGPPLPTPPEAESAPAEDVVEPVPAPESPPAPAPPVPTAPQVPIAPEPPVPTGEPLSPQSFRGAVPKLEIALAAGAVARSLDRWIPTLAELAEYLPTVRDLLATTALRTQRKKVLPGEYAEPFRNLVLTTAWQESCWRQFVRRGGKLQPLTSSVGAVGIMQVNARVWRGFYDVNSLRNSTKYNAEAGSEILHHYFVDYAIKRQEDQVRKNPDDLARATYAAYNAGPRQLDRYRRKIQGKTGHRIDADFWAKYQKIQAGDDLAVKACFPGLAT